MSKADDKTVQNTPVFNGYLRFFFLGKNNFIKRDYFMLNEHKENKELQNCKYYIQKAYLKTQQYPYL